ncbi:MAG: hypothetical protein WBD40_09065 [Tepidisphaeraceae bacterium]
MSPDTGSLRPLVPFTRRASAALRNGKRLRTTITITADKLNDDTDQPTRARRTSTLALRLAR